MKWKDLDPREAELLIELQLQKCAVVREILEEAEDWENSYRGTSQVAPAYELIEFLRERFGGKK